VRRGDNLAVSLGVCKLFQGCVDIGPRLFFPAKRSQHMQWTGFIPGRTPENRVLATNSRNGIRVGYFDGREQIWQAGNCYRLTVVASLQPKQ
jgi:hypothetical protein